MILDHIALLVAEIEPVLKRLADLDLPAGEIETFPGEGTREVYLGDPKRPALLLLLQPISEGPYARALAKRGPSLHHVAIQVPDLNAFAGQVKGWLLHPHSLESQRKANTLWFARPGVGTLLEVTSGKGGSGEGSVQVGVSLSDPELAPLLGLASAGGPVAGLEAAEDEAWIQVAGARRLLSELLA
ncbi:MAG: hypothetical protein JKY65_33855 [Planctomycetes bacterium]|nr:hypothetical protein [Planctomycetota bacterium]